MTTDFEEARERGRRAAEDAMSEEREPPAPRTERKRLTREERIALMEISKPLPAAIRNRLLGGTVCEECGGDGIILIKAVDHGGTSPMINECHICDGKGRVPDAPEG